MLATQNPIEQEGTYPLPEAQLDRFMFNVLIDYPSYADEVRIVESTTGAADRDLQRVLAGSDVLAFQDLVRQVPVAENVTELRGAPGAGHPRRHRTRPPRRPPSTWPGAPARAPPSSWSAAPRPGPCWTAARRPTSTTSAAWPARCCATGW